jgi:predicted secreted protein
MVRSLILGLALCLAQQTFAAQTVATDIQRRAATSVVLGQRLTLRLPNRVESGRTWYLMNSPLPELQFVSQRMERPEIELPDVAQNQIFEFNTRKSGVKLLRFGYGVGPGQPAQRILNVTVTIKGN